MNKIIKIILIVLNIILIAGAMATIGYFWGWKTIENNLMQRGFNLAVGQIIQSVQQTGQVQLSQDLILIKK